MISESVTKLAITFVNDNDFESDGRKVVDKMMIIFNKCKWLYEAIAGRVQFDNTHVFSWKCIRANEKFEMENVDVELKVSNTTRTQFLGKEEVRTLGLHVCPKL